MNCSYANTNKCKAQVSLEYLILLAGFFSVLALIIPQTIKLFEASVFALDAKNASAFSQEISAAINELSILEDGSIKSISFSPLLEWNISAQNNSIQIEVINEKIAKNKVFSIQTNTDLFSFNKNFSSKSSIKLSKKEGKILIENS